MNKNPTMRVGLYDAFKTNFSVFDSYDVAVKNEQIELFSYIETIAGQLEKRLDGVNLFELFPNNNNILYTDRSRIKEILINYEPQIVEEETKQLSEEHMKAIADIFEKFTTVKKEQLNRRIRERIRGAQLRYSEYQEYMTAANGDRRELANIETMDCSFLTKDIETLMNDRRFELNQIDSNNRISFKIKDNIILTHKNPRAGIDLRVDLGKFNLILRIHDSGVITISAAGIGENLRSEGHLHPHIGTEGDICFGNMSELAEDYRSERKICQLVDVTYKVLTTYGEENPYVSLGSFAERSQQVQPNGVIHEHNSELRYNNVECVECGYDFEVEFPSEDDGDYTEACCPECDNWGEYEY